MGVVSILPDHVANQIAAGEVVERPASVVKELVENSLDAGATHVRVEVDDGGKSLIRIIDNGSGMSEEDALLALQRHATSKVVSADDLHSINSLGFRGEALPSIRSVSRFSIRTRRSENDVGVRITADGADTPTTEPVGCPTGTDITVRELFFNTPARRKFLKRTATEMSRITELMDRFALGWPHVHFSLIHNGKRRSERPADRDLQARILSVLGRDVCRQLFPVRLEMGEHSVFGYTAEPSFHRPNARGMYTYINGRFVRDKVVQHAITQAYGTLLDRGRYPTCVLYLVLPPSSVDVNVHPAKAEVRFVESGAVHGLIERALRLTLADAPWGYDSEAILSPSSGPLGGMGTEADGLSGLFSGAPRAGVSMESDELPPFDDQKAQSSEEHTEGYAASVESGPDTPDKPGFFKSLKFHAQIGRRYLLCESPNSLHLVDQHAAHQRVLFERLLAAWKSNTSPSQRMLFPIPMTLTPALAEAAGAYARLMQRLGLGVEPFGGAEWVITEVPDALADRDPVATASHVLRLLVQRRPGPDSDYQIEVLLAAMASHGAYRHGDELTSDAARALLVQLDGLVVDSSANSGMPVLVSHPFARIARWFDGS